MNDYITDKTFQFLLELRDNNNKEWFNENKDRFESDLREPLLKLIADFQDPLNRISSAYRAIPKKSGGSLFRIFRDVRFSPNKEPYKTNAGIHFRHKDAKDVHAPGFYLHIDPEGCFVGMGIWKPEAEPLKQIRERIANKPEEWKRVTSSPALGAGLEVAGDKLKRPPRGFDRDHPMIEDLKRKDFLVSRNITIDEILADEFLRKLEELFMGGREFMAFLGAALGIDF